MDGIRPRHGRDNNMRTQHRPAHISSVRGFHVGKKKRHSGEMYWLVRSLGKSAATGKLKLWQRFQKSEFAKWPDKNIWQRVFALLTLGLFMTSTTATLVQPFLNTKPYKLTNSIRSVLPNPSQNLAKYLEFNTKEATFTYNSAYSPSVKSEAGQAGNGTPRITASFSADPTKGVTVTDPVSQSDLTVQPKFRMQAGKKDQNQVVYRLNDADGLLVYTAQIASVKEDIVLESPGKDRQAFDYELKLADGLSARLEKDGSVGVYGSDLPVNGNVSTGSEKDAGLLQKVRQNAPKTKFLFGIPAPIVKEAGKKQSTVSAYFELKGTNLRVVANGLKKANYPLSIDPSVYVQSAAQLMRGNNESNVAFDVSNELFKKGSTTGARIDEWTETGAMNDATYDQGVAAAGGYMYRAGGRSGRIMPWIASQKTSALSTTSGSFVMDMPVVRPAGDLYVALIAHDVQGTNVVTPPAGWTEYADVGEHAAYYRVGTNVSGGNEAATYTWTKTGTTAQWSGVILRIKNFDVTSVVSATGTSASAATPVFPAVTPNAQGALLLRAASFNDDVPNSHGYSPTNHDDIASGTSGGAAGVGFVVTRMDSPPASGSTTGTATMPTSAGISDTYGASTVAINGVAATPAYNQTLQWAHFNSTTGSIDSTAPGSNGTLCSGWCTDTAYDLPSGGTTSTGVGNVGMSMIAYNGYLYAIGGYDGTNLKSTVYIAKLGINGEPSLWHPTDPNQANWVYWYKDSGLSGATARAYHSAYAYNGRMYMLGGRTSVSGNGGGVTTVQIADILPNGTLGTWASGQALPEARWGLSVQAYNSTLYILGGGNSGSLLNTVWFSRLNSDGTMNTWQQAASFTTARESHGGVMSSIWGGYIYLAGGCTTVNSTGTGYCSAIASDTQVASINADGSLDIWNTMANLRNTRIGSSFISWQDNLYRFGGCSKQDTATGDCYAVHLDIQYGTINQDGDASTVSVSSASGSGLCVTPDPYNCNLPPGGTGSGQGGQALGASAILNGYLYVIGGCTTNACTTMSGNTSYAAIDSTGKLKRPPSCSGGTYGSWCVDSTNTVSGGIGAAGVAVFNGTIYLVGGQNGSAGVNKVFRNTFNADGSLSGAWQSQNLSGGTNIGATSVSYTYAYARANPSTASTVPGNLYIFGGCSSPAAGAGCTVDAETPDVYKCRILTSGAIDDTTGTPCTKTGQLQIGTLSGASAAGLGVHAGTVYANYIYLIGGLAPGRNDLPLVHYAKFDNSNNVVAVSGSAWIESSVQMKNGRRRGTAFGYNGYIYAVGGYDSTSTQILDTIEFVKINVSDGSLVDPGTSKFTQSAVTFSQRWGLGLAVSNSYAYIIGGCKDGVSPTCNAGGLDDTVQTFQVYNNDSGSPSLYTTSANLYSTDTSRIGASAAIYNGYLYVAGGCTASTSSNDCSATSASVQYAAIDANGAISSTWQTGGSLPAARGWGQLEIAGGTLYYLGGQTGADTTAVSTVYYTTGISSGNPTWSGSAASGGVGDTAGQAAVALSQFGATVWNNRIYVTGGNNATPTAQLTVYVSPQLNSGGNIAADSWTALTSFNVARSGHVAIAYANNLYILGGYTGSVYLSDVQFAQISSNGTIGSWSYTTSLPTPIRQADGFASNGYMYLFGGRSSTNDCTARTLVAPISANTTIASGNNPTGIGEWYQTNANFDGGRYGAAAINYQGKAFVVGGGCQGIVMQDDFDGPSSPYYDATQWSFTTGMTAGTACQSTSTSKTFYITTGGAGNYAATNDLNVSSGGTIYFKLYIPGADTGTCYTTEANFLGGSPDDVILQYSNSGGAWTNIQTFAYNGNYDPMVRLAISIPAGAQSATTKFRWIMPQGEANDSFAIEDVSIAATSNTSIAYTTSTRVTQTPLLSQPQLATYSRLIDADHDVFPTKWLMNGLDNSIGARWQLRYRSMNDPTVTDATKACGGSAMTAFGQETNFGDVTLGQTGTYTVKNGGGTDISCGRYFFMTVSIDASQTYGYPDDITRGPTLSDLTLFFNANPGQRLIHGKTFIEGTQQPLDTQPP